jgi:hypothetical protein
LLAIAKNLILEKTSSRPEHCQLNKDRKQRQDSNTHEKAKKAEAEVILPFLLL